MDTEKHETVDDVVARQQRQARIAIVRNFMVGAAIILLAVIGFMTLIGLHVHFTWGGY